MAYEFFEPFPDVRGIKNLFTKELIANPKLSFEYKRSVANPKFFSFLNMANFIGHFKVEHDPWAYKSALEKFYDDERKRLEKDEKNHNEYLNKLHKLEEEVKNASAEEKQGLQSKIAHMKEHDAQHLHSKAEKRPEKFDKRFTNYEGDLENKFDNDDSCKFKYTNSHLFEGNFVMKNLLDKNAILGGDSSDLRRNVHDYLKNRELNIIIGKELGKSALKNINFQIKNKTSSEQISFSIHNNIDHYEKVKKVNGEDQTIKKDKIQNNYKLVYNYPVNENLKVKATFVDDFLSNNHLELKFRKNFFGKLTFQNYYMTKFGFGTETLHSKEKTVDHEIKYHFKNALINVLRPEKAVFALSYDLPQNQMHKLKPYFGFVIHNTEKNDNTSINLGYLHNMDFTKKDIDGNVSGLKINYSLFYKYDNFFQKIESLNLFGHSHHGHDTTKKPHEGKSHLSLGSEYIYLLKKNPYLTSITGKVLVSENAIRFHKNYSFKKWGDYFNSLNLAMKFNIEKEKGKHVYKSGVSVEFA